MLAGGQASGNGRGQVEAPAALLAVAYYALLPTVGGFRLRYAGAARVGVMEAALFTALAPVAALLPAALLPAALLPAALLLDEPVTPRPLAGIAFVAAAVGVPARRPAYRSQALPPTP